MPRLLILYDPDGNVKVHPDGGNPAWQYASLDLAEGWENKDIYEIARKLSEMLLEQLVAP